MVRLLSCAGLEVVALEEPEKVAAEVKEDTALLCCDGFDVDLALQILKTRPRVRAWLWTAEPIDRLLEYSLEEPRISNLFGRPSFDATPREWELLWAARRLFSGDPPPLAVHLNWGFTGFQEQPRTSEARDRTVHVVQEFVERIGCPKRVVDTFGELAHELLMNAMYDAPVGPDGKPKFAHDRKSRIELAPEEAPTLRLASDGVTLAIQVVDPFGRLARRHVFGGLLRGLKGGEMDLGGGGAGLGMLKIYQSTCVMLFDVTPGRRTEVTGLFNLDLNLREFRTLAKSVHFFQNNMTIAARGGART
ncbi:MAG TPA: hypothetical protein VKN99_22810 [Polyangia bacterium]|nr:hypothetical protein [Polyangia bacterium]